MDTNGYSSTPINIQDDRERLMDERRNLVRKFNLLNNPRNGGISYKDYTRTLGAVTSSIDDLNHLKKLSLYEY